MQPMPGQPVAQQPVQVQAVPAQGQMPVNAYTAKEEKEWGIFTYTPAEWVTGALVTLGLLFWMLSYWSIDAEDPSIGAAWFWQGAAYTFWFGAIVSAVHSVEKALLNSKK
tara:strand:- start:92 stop:421 length:330 start_codon:yes stop_codon:yes gene_type:complete